MRRGIGIAVFVLLILAGIGIGVTAYNAGVTHGLDEAAKGTQVVHVVGPAFGFGFFPFGLLLFPLLLFVVLRIGRRAAFRRGGWGGPGHGGPGHHGPWSDEGRAKFEERAREWHRKAHEPAGEAGDGAPTGAST